MSLLVQKYGGTSLATPERVGHVARRVVASADAGAQVCVVVSAMGAATDDLLSLAGGVSAAPPAADLDVLLATGEQASSALLSMAIRDLGRAAVPLTGAQAGIVTDARHGRARIAEVRPGQVRAALEAGAVAVVAGFQGVCAGGRLTTLGRGGSDTTAVALAAALGADRCEIYTDVEGVLSADPRVVPDARLLPAVAYEEMLELSASGARVLVGRSVEYARRHGVRLAVRSSFEDVPGTEVTAASEVLERPAISGIAHDTSEARVTVAGIPARPHAVAGLLRSVAEEAIDVDMIVQGAPVDGATDISFTVPEHDLLRAEAAVAPAAAAAGCRGVETDRGVGKVSVVGVGMSGHSGVAMRVFETLSEEGIDVELVSTSSIRISCLVRVGAVACAVRALHRAFGLG
ncbi:MAG TPA: aspartate kinase, partial [Solirubrobacteraceae bacterium]|nr:aspartate kinase [Solirubrobacteraceae bacterium]